MSEPELRTLTDAAQLQEALAQAAAVVYKHSPRCGGSRRALWEIERFATARPEVPVYLVDVIGSRPFSGELAERLGVRHESPQAILLRRGEVMWHASHGGVTAEALEAALG